MEEEIERIISNYAHDYRDMEMPEDELKNLLRRIIEEIFQAYP